MLDPISHMQSQRSHNSIKTRQFTISEQSNISYAIFKLQRTSPLFSTEIPTIHSSVIRTQTMLTIPMIANLPPVYSFSLQTALYPSKAQNNPSSQCLQWNPNIWLSPKPQKKPSSYSNYFALLNSMPINLFSSKLTPSPLSITSKITSSTLVQNTSTFVIILFAAPALTVMLLFNMFPLRPKLPTF